MGKAVWTGTISFGLLNVDAALESAVGDDPKDVSFKQLCPCHDEPVAAPRTCRTTGDVVPSEQLHKGVEVSRGTFVAVDTSALADIDESFRDVKEIITIDHFVPLAAVAPLTWRSGHYYVRAYGRGVPRAMALLHTGLADTQTVGIGQVVMRARQYVCGIYAWEDALGLSLMAYEPQVRAPGADCTAHMQVQLSVKEVDLVRQLVQASMQDVLDLSPFTDKVVERKRKAVDEVVAGKPVSKPTAPAVPKQEVDLSKALEAMLKKSGDAPKPKRSRRAA